MMLYIVRHGETDWNRMKKVQGRTDIPLNDYGRHLAEETAEGMKEIRLDLAYTSPLRRARETAEKNRPCAVVLIPDADVYAKPRAWASALSSASYLVVIGDKKDKNVRNFMRIVDGVIFSPVPRHLSSAFIAESREEALSLISGVLETFPTAITMRVEHNVDEEDEE